MITIFHCSICWCRAKFYRSGFFFHGCGFYRNVCLNSFNGDVKKSNGNRLFFCHIFFSLCFFFLSLVRFAIYSVPFYPLVVTLIVVWYLILRQNSDKTIRIRVFFFLCVFERSTLLMGSIYKNFWSSFWDFFVIRSNCARIGVAIELEEGIREAKTPKMLGNVCSCEQLTQS